MTREESRREYRRRKRGEKTQECDLYTHKGHELVSVKNEKSVLPRATGQQHTATLWLRRYRSPPCTRAVVMALKRVVALPR